IKVTQSLSASASSAISNDKSQDSIYDINESVEGNEIVDAETTNDESESPIPDSFRLLKDERFPLLITFDKFSKMLHGTYEVDVQKLIKRQKSDIDNEEETYFSFNSFDTFNPHFVEYRIFTIKYSPRLSDFYTQKLDCELVYSEFSL
ncbi:15539_t:CDS:2, partial [Cetraspora pellucida]